MDFLGNFENLVKPILDFFEKNKIIFVILIFVLSALIFFYLRRKDFEPMTTQNLKEDMKNHEMFNDYGGDNEDSDLEEPEK